MTMKVLKLLCGYERPLPTRSLTRLMVIACVFIFLSYVQTGTLSDVTENAAHDPSMDCLVLLGLGLCSLLVVRRRKPWLS